MALCCEGNNVTLGDTRDITVLDEGWCKPFRERMMNKIKGCVGSHNKIKYLELDESPKLCLERPHRQEQWRQSREDCTCTEQSPQRKSLAARHFIPFCANSRRVGGKNSFRVNASTRCRLEGLYATRREQLVWDKGALLWAKQRDFLLK